MRAACARDACGAMRDFAVAMRGNISERVECMTRTQKKLVFDAHNV
jgi:hypothetical protein